MKKRGKKKKAMLLDKPRKARNQVERQGREERRREVAQANEQQAYYVNQKATSTAGAVGLLSAHRLYIQRRDRAEVVVSCAKKASPWLLQCRLDCFSSFLFVVASVGRVCWYVLLF